MSPRRVRRCFGLVQLGTGPRAVPGDSGVITWKDLSINPEQLEEVAGEGAASETRTQISGS